MKRIALIVVAVLAALFVMLQFFRPDDNSGEISPDHIYKSEQLTTGIEDILQNACMDCHSDQTRYLWYHRIVPVSWMINKHISEGKKELNFSEWGQMDITDKIGKLDEMAQEVKRKDMPLKSYSVMHKKAKLSDDQLAAFNTWTESLSEELLRELIK